MARLIYTQHAEDMLDERGISKAEVASVWEEYHASYPGTHQTRKTTVRVGDGGDGEPLWVVVATQKPRVIVTTYRKDES